MSVPIPRLAADDTVLLVVDVQDKLLAAMPGAATLVRNVRLLLDVARLLEVPVRATEQYPKGLGRTTATVAECLTGPVPAKTTFSCCGSAELADDLAGLAPKAVVVCGMETHVCVAQTVLDLLAARRTVFVPVDAVQSRFAVDHDAALRRLERAGAIPTTVEAVAFEWLRDAAHPQFKAVSKLVIGRAAAG